MSQQTLADSGTFEFAYTLADGDVTQADVTDPRGQVTRTAFNASGYALSTVEAVGTALARTTTIARDSTSKFITSRSSFIPTPPFPDYISGHSTFSGAAAVVLALLFPDAEPPLLVRV